jgi:hypothetical protein
MSWSDGEAIFGLGIVMDIDVKNKMGLKNILI